MLQGKCYLYFRCIIWVQHPLTWGWTSHIETHLHVRGCCAHVVYLKLPLWSYNNHYKEVVEGETTKGHGTKTHVIQQQHEIKTDNITITKFHKTAASIVRSGGDVVAREAHTWWQEEERSSGGRRRHVGWSWEIRFISKNIQTRYGQNHTKFEQIQDPSWILMSLDTFFFSFFNLNFYKDFTFIWISQNKQTHFIENIFSNVGLI